MTYKAASRWTAASPFPAALGSGEESRRLVHELRAVSDAVAVAGNGAASR